MHKHGISTIVFDLGNVMIRLAGGWDGACARVGIPYIPAAFGEERRPMRQALEVRFESGLITPETYYTELCTLLDGHYSLDETRRIYQAIIAEEFPGITEIVTSLKQACYFTACLSNTCMPHWADLTNPKLYPGIGLLHVHHASCRFGVMKPDAEIYRLFEQAVGKSADEILFFDDRLANVEGARTCGWHAEQIDETKPAVEQIRAELRRYAIL
ncbi:MAG TPA: HAD family phosphatase [Armatimonadota bacterium]|nr:HAD family phosphatase [Armatimonadota bacterium]